MFFDPPGYDHQIFWGNTVKIKNSMDPCRLSPSTGMSGFAASKSTSLPTTMVGSSTAFIAVSKQACGTCMHLHISFANSGYQFRIGSGAYLSSGGTLLVRPSKGDRPTPFHTSPIAEPCRCWTACDGIRFRRRTTKQHLLRAKAAFLDLTVNQHVWLSRSSLVTKDRTICFIPRRRCYNLEAAKKPRSHIKQELSKEDLYPDNTVRAFRAMFYEGRLGTGWWRTWIRSWKLRDGIVAEQLLQNAGLMKITGSWSAPPLEERLHRRRCVRSW